LERVIKACSDVAHVEAIPMMDGRRMVMIVSPRPQRGAAPPGGPVSGPVNPVPGPGSAPRPPAVVVQGQGQQGQPVGPRRGGPQVSGSAPPQRPAGASGSPSGGTSTPAAPVGGRPPVRSGS